MPGYDRTGPVGAGPRTGRGLGRCGRPDDRITRIEDTYPDYRAGWFPRRWGGGPGRGRGGRGRGRGFGMGWWGVDDPVADDLAPRQREAFLRRRIQDLTAQLDRLAKPFSGDSPEDEQHED
jgi:hypothetical protein